MTASSDVHLLVTDRPHRGWPGTSRCGPSFR